MQAECLLSATYYWANASQKTYPLLAVKHSTSSGWCHLIFMLLLDFIVLFVWWVYGKVLSVFSILFCIHRESLCWVRLVAFWFQIARARKRRQRWLVPWLCSVVVEGFVSVLEFLQWIQSQLVRGLRPWQTALFFAIPSSAFSHSHAVSVLAHCKK